MCLEIKRSKFNRFLQDKLSILCNPKPKTARKDITVFKVLYSDIFPHSIHFPFTWDYDYVYNTDLSVSIGTKSPHTYIYSVEFIVNDGFHAFINKDLASTLAKNNLNWKVYKAIIPKGAKYYIGIHGDIVSNQLKILRRID